jgi:hypothetical protein
VFIALFALDSPLLFVVMLQGVVFICIYVAEWRRPDRDMHLGLNILAFVFFLLIALLYWFMGGEEPALFAAISVVPAAVLVLRLLLVGPKASAADTEP